MLFGKIKLKNFESKKSNFKIKKDLKKLIKENNKILNTLKSTYEYSYNKSIILRNKNFKKLNIIGMGGSILGAEAIYNFLKNKIKKKIVFFNNLSSNLKSNKNNKKDLNLIISKSGNTLETIVSSNILIKNKNKNIFIVENQKNYLNNLAKKLKGEIIEHKNYIGGRYSVLSEVGMLPSELMGLNEKNFKQFNFLIKNKNFINNLIKSVESILFYLSGARLLKYSNTGPPSSIPDVAMILHGESSRSGSSLPSACSIFVKYSESNGLSSVSRIFWRNVRSKYSGCAS